MPIDRSRSGGSRSYTRAPRVSLGRGTRFGSDGSKRQGTWDPAVRVGGPMGYRKNQDQASTAGGTKF